MPQIKIHAHTSLVGADAKVFFDFITQHQQRNVSFFKKGMSVSFNDSMISFEDDVLFEEASGSFTCNFLGQKLGEGSYGVVYDVDQSMTLSSIEFSPSGYRQPQVVKIQHHCHCDRWGSCFHHNTLGMLEKEYRVSAKTQHLDVHRPILNDEKTVSYTVMNKLPGVNLCDILDNDLQKKPALSLQHRIELSLALFKAAKDQITALNLIHFDIKPGNIMVDFSVLPIRVNFLDYAFGEEIAPGNMEVLTRCHVGTMSYISPEVFLTEDYYHATAAIDLFALMRLLMLIWGGRDISFGDMPYHQRQQYFIEAQNLDQLFRELPEDQVVTLRHLGLDAMIRAILTIGLSRNPHDRGTIDDAILAFHKIYHIYQEVKQEIPMDVAAKACAKLERPLSQKRKASEDGEMPLPPVRIDFQLSFFGPKRQAAPAIPGDTIKNTL